MTQHWSGGGEKAVNRGGRLVALTPQHIFLLRELVDRMPHATLVDAYLADSLCRFDLTVASRASMYADADRTAEPAAYASVRYGLPIALVTGDRDPVNRFLKWFDPLAAPYRRWGFADVSASSMAGLDTNRSTRPTVTRSSPT